MIKDFILPEFVTDSKLCEQELQTIEDNISYLENLRLEYLKKLAKLTGKKVWKQHLFGYQNITNYGVGDSPEDLCHYVLNYNNFTVDFKEDWEEVKCPTNVKS